jgi:antitoxin component YwqK of YwqJK toxin-antitoxin module
MSKLILIFLLLTSLAHANLGTYKNGKFIYPDTNKPYTGNLDVINNDWGKDAVEFNKNYVDGVLHGAEKVFYRSGKLKSVGYFNKGLIDGATTLYYEDGSVQAQVNFNNGVKEGRAASYYLDGSKQLEQFFSNDKLDGLSREWYDTGSLMISRDYSKGLLHGEVTTYYESGKVFEVTKFNYGTPKYKAVYRKDGSLADEQGFLNRKIIDSIIS